MLFPSSYVGHRYSPQHLVLEQLRYRNKYALMYVASLGTERLLHAEGHLDRIFEGVGRKWHAITNVHCREMLKRGFRD
jgi:hypothetical protein